MAKSATLALVLASLLVCSLAADTGRELLQQQQVKYDCDGAKMIATVRNGCQLLCQCAGSLNSAYRAQAAQGQCVKMCNSCSAAAAKCPKGAPLPKECSAGTSIKEVNTCINTFLASRSRSG